MSNRLLSEQEIFARVTEWRESHDMELISYTEFYQVIAKAQRDLTIAAVNAEWVEEMEVIIRYYTFLCNQAGIFPDDYLWQERKRSVGL